ncbi:Cell-cell adhesion protein [Phytophthora megakarya]|uniref:Cell-cell adhesion protein n=1 Tax=Phytophthora megakarya TaxID=4795 RepID=A0A225WZQ5_9STRA|nr:Cell-cell adhesion protein [Phytophthora megakarya]
MTDRWRKRSTTSSYASDIVVDFNAVTPSNTRRRSESIDDSGIRHESWMSKVSLAMSSRIFSGGKKLRGSRSTQVIPTAVMTDSINTSIGRVSSSSVSSLQNADVEQIPTANGEHIVDLEKAFGGSTDLSSPVSTFAYSSVTSDVDSNDQSDRIRGDKERFQTQSLTSRRGDSQRWGSRRHSSTVVQKVTPGNEFDEEEVTTRPLKILIPSIAVRSRDFYDDTNAQVNVHDAAPILKGFFSKSVVVSKEQRQQELQQKRETIYRESKQRQNKLREQIKREHEENEKSSRKQKVEQLRRLNQQRRMELLRTAVSARKDLLDRIQSDNKKYQTERERWEDDFEDEMRVLNAAFRKARTSDENRPMTVAGLAVPEAISQIEREASNYEKRVKTAQPALVSTSPQRMARPKTSGNSDMSSSSFFESCTVLALEDSKDVFDLFRGDEQESDVFPSKHSNVLNHRQLLDMNLDELQDEREKLLQRLDAIECMVQSQQEQP